MAATYSFKNIAYTPSQMKSTSYVYGTRATVDVTDREYQLYPGNTFVMSCSNNNSESYINITGNGIITEFLKSGHVYYTCYWIRINGTSLSKTTQLYVGDTIDNDNDLFAFGTAYSNKWSRISGINMLHDSAGVPNKGRFDLDNPLGVTAFITGILIVDLTAHNLQDKSVEWCDNHLYWVQTNQTGETVDYTTDIGTDTDIWSTSAPNASSLKVIHDLIAGKRGQLPPSSVTVYASAAWINSIINSQNSLKSQGGTFGTCGVVNLTPSGWISNSMVSSETSFLDSGGMTLVNNLIKNADSLYAEQKCIESSLKYSNCTCVGGDCCNGSDCSDCCHSGDSCSGNCCDAVCLCDGVGCRSNICCDNYSSCYTTCCDNDDCGYCYDQCECQAVCSCDTVCSCNWV